MVNMEVAARIDTHLVLNDFVMKASDELGLIIHPRSKFRAWAGSYDDREAKRVIQSGV